MVKKKQKAERGQSWREAPPVKLSLSIVHPKSTGWVQNVKLKCWPKYRNGMYIWGDDYYAITAITADGTVSRCDKELKVELNILDVTEGGAGIPLTDPNSITVSKAKSLQYYFFHTLNWLWPGKYIIEFTPHSKRFPNIEPLHLHVSVKGPGGHGRESIPDELDGDVEETEELVSNVIEEDTKKRTRKRGHECEITASLKGTRRNSKKVKHKKSHMTVKETKLEKVRAAASNVSSGNLPKSRVSARISKSGDARHPEPVETKKKRSSPLEELEIAQYGKKKVYQVLDEGISNVIVRGTGNRCVVRMPPSLLQFLEQDRMVISKGKGLCPLPRVPSVSEILLTFKRLLRSEDTSGQMMLNYLEAAFNALLEPCLLNPAERPQLAKLREKKPNLSPSSIYGGEHLLRLIMIIPSCISPGDDPDTRDDHKKITPFTNSYVPKLNIILDRLLGFLQEKRKVYFVINDYIHL